MFKHTILLALCVFLFQQSVASSNDEAKNAFYRMMEAIDKALTDAQNALNKAVDEVKAKATELEGKAKVELDKTLAPLRGKLNELIAKAKEKGFDVTKCQNYVDHFSKTPDDLVHNLIDCINKQISKAQQIVNDALDNAKKIEQDLKNIDQEIDNCDGNKWKQVICYAKIIEKIAEDTKNAPQQIAKDVADATFLISNILPILEQCFADQLKKAGENALKDVKDFAVCVAIPF